jgi:sulfite oxidase
MTKFMASHSSRFHFPSWQLLALPLLVSFYSVADCEDDKVYRRKDVEQHKSKEGGIWVTYKDGVYDITKFVPNHPGGRDKIMLAAGEDIEPFWNIYRQHFNSALPQELLKSMRIGNLHPDDVYKPPAGAMKEGNPYKNDPSLSPVLKYLQRQPINAEAPGFLLVDSWITPKELWFVRNHHPVPNISAENFSLDIVFADDFLAQWNENKLSAESALKNLTLKDLKSKFPKYSVVTSIQCGGNRRLEMSEIERTNGSNWSVSAMSTAKWSGARLRDVLNDIGINEETLYDENGMERIPIRHVHFVGAEGMEASIPIRKALSRFGDVVLAYEMNDEELPVQHGFPLRAIVPGHVGVRNVKWVSKIRLSGEEAGGPWQRGMAYKGFGPSLKSLENVDVEKIPSLQEQPVTSAICYPSQNSKITADDVLTVKGYAYSGGGRGIVRVDVSIDGGKTWKSAALTDGSSQSLDRAWAWTLWECDFDIPNSPNQKIQIISKATDAAYNVQPDSVQGIWNLRGINNNAWHRVQVEIKEADRDSDIE